MPIYHNVGRNITNGIYYNLNQSGQDYKGKAFLIYDVLSDKMPQEDIEVPAGLSVKRVRQYKGYLSSLEGFGGFEDYFANQFSSKSRTNLRKYLKRLDTNFNTEFKVFHGKISKEEYDVHFGKMLDLIEKRFEELELENNILRLQDYYYDLCYKMILNKEASLNVLYVNEEPAAISFCFLSPERAYFAITTFDTDFRRYNLGHVLIMKIMEWCFDNNIKEFDYSKGTYDYKTRWSNKFYYFENHILYDKTSLKALFYGNLFYYFFRVKQFLRDIEFNKLYSRIKFFLKKKETKSETIDIQELDTADFDKNKYQEISISEKPHSNVKSVVYDLAFSKPQKVEDIKVYANSEKSHYFIQGKGISKKVVFTA